MKCGMADGKLYDAVIVGLDPTGDVALIKLLGRDDFPHAELGDSDQVQVGDWCFAIGNPFLLATDFQPTVSLRHHLRRASLSVSGRHAAGIRRLPADRRRDQSRQLRRAAVRRRGAADRHQRPRLVRKARPRERRRRLRHLDQPDQELPRPLEERPDRRSRHARRAGRAATSSGAWSSTTSWKSPTPIAAACATATRSSSFGGRPITHGQRLQERAGHLSQGLARAAVVPAQGRAVRRAGAACAACIARRNWPRWCRAAPKIEPDKMPQPKADEPKQDDDAQEDEAAPADSTAANARQAGPDAGDRQEALHREARATPITISTS